MADGLVDAPGGDASTATGTGAMKYFVPELRLGVQSPAQNQPLDKFGGLPWGMPASKWPHCSSCRKSMALIAQLFHQEQRLDLGAPGRCLFVFMCCTPETGCSDTFDSRAGSNASFVLEPGELDSDLTRPPDADVSWPIWSVQSCGLAGVGNYGQKLWVNVEARVISWREQDGDSHQDIYPHTKIGGAPFWLQGPHPEADGLFAAQFSESFVFPPPMPQPDEIGSRVTAGEIGNTRYSNPAAFRHDGPHDVNDISPPDPKFAAGSWCCSSANFGTGMAYLLLRPNDAAPPTCEFTWQC
jgi:hypothetical protein